VFEASPCYAWNNTLNGAKLNMILRPWNPKETELQAEHVKEGRDFFNEAPKPEYYRRPIPIRTRCKLSPDANFKRCQNHKRSRITQTSAGPSAALPDPFRGSWRLGP